MNRNLYSFIIMDVPKKERKDENRIIIFIIAKYQNNFMAGGVENRFILSPFFEGITRKKFHE